MLLSVALFALMTAGCSATTNTQHRAALAGLVETSHPVLINRQAARGIDLPLGAEASITIDVEGIIDFVQGDKSAAIEAEPVFCNDQHPWICICLRF